MDRFNILFRLNEQKIFIVSLIFVVIVSFLSTIFVDLKKTSIEHRIELINNKYQKALLLYKKIKENNSSKQIFKRDILLFVQELEKIPNLKEKIISVNSSESGSSIVIKMAELNLKQLCDVLYKLNLYKNIQVTSYIIKKDFSFKKLLDLTISIRKL